MNENLKRFEQLVDVEVVFISGDSITVKMELGLAAGISDTDILKQDAALRVPIEGGALAFRTPAIAAIMIKGYTNKELNEISKEVRAL